MKIPGRQDLLPLVGLAVAIIVLFSTPLTRVISWARVAEEQSGLAIFPALVVLAASLAFYAFRRRHAEQVAALAETAAILVVQKKLQAIWGDGDVATAQKNER